MNENKINKLVIAVTFFYVEDRLRYLKKIASQYNNLVERVEVFIITNTNIKDEQNNIIDAIKDYNLNYKIMVPELLGHPFLLTWCHLNLFKWLFDHDEEISHFMYTEDDICVHRANIDYWLKGRNDLRDYGLIPSFFRYEINANNGKLYSSDQIEHINPYEIPRVDISQDYSYVNLPKPYQGIYLLDRDLMGEHLNGPSSSPDFGIWDMRAIAVHGIWDIRAKAAQGIMFANVPSGCNSRNFVGYNLKTGLLDPGCLIHHTPNNYANNPKIKKLGKLPIQDLFYPKLKISFRTPRLKPASTAFESIKPYVPKPLRPVIRRLLARF